MDEEPARLCDHAGFPVQLYAGEKCLRFGADHRGDGYFIFGQCGWLLYRHLGQCFTKLVLRLRESGMTVIGMGERKTPNAFVSACETFKFLDILLNDEIRRRIRPCRRRARRVRRMVPEKRQRKKATECSQQYSEHGGDGERDYLDHQHTCGR